MSYSINRTIVELKSELVKELSELRAKHQSNHSGIEMESAQRLREEVEKHQSNHSGIEIVFVIEVMGRISCINRTIVELKSKNSILNL